MSTMVVLSGGGIKGAVAAGRLAKDHEVILLHVDFGQESSLAEVRTLTALAPFWPAARVLTLTLPRQDYSSTIVRSSVGMVSGGPGRESPESDRVSAALTARSVTPLLLSIATRTALRYGAGSVVFGVSAFAAGEAIGLPGVEAGPDALREAVHGFNIMLDALLRPRSRVRVETPLIDMSYMEIIKLGRRLNVPFERTWSCETRAAHPCGSCPSCGRRRDAFTGAGFVDPSAEPAGTAGGRVQTS